MAIRRIPLPSRTSPIRSQRTDLNGVSYRIDWRYNARVHRWYFSIFDSDDSPVVTSRPLVAQYPLLTAVSKPSRPPGQLLLVTPNGEDPDIDTISDARLYYFEADSD